MSVSLLSFQLEHYNWGFHLSAEEREEGGAVLRGKNSRAAIVRIDPTVAEEALFRKLQQQVIEDEKIDEVLARLSELKSGPEQVAAIVHVVMKQNVGTLLGYIIPPESGAGIIKDRIVQIAVVLLEMLREKVQRIEEEISQSLREGKDYEVNDRVRELIQEHHSAIIAIREIMNRFLVLYHLNLPPGYRPPLAQVKLGMEVITTEG